MPCLIAFVVLSIMGIFSTTHRPLAKEALGCIGRRVTLRACDTGFQEKVHGQLIGFLMNRSVTVARFVRKYFEVLAWLLFILTLWSLFATVDGLYNFYRYGSCDGLNVSSFCVLNPTGSNNAVSNIDVIDNTLLPAPCSDDVEGSGYLSSIPLTLTDYPRLDRNSRNEVIFMGCFECENTRIAYPTVRRLVDEEQPNFTFVHHPTRGTTNYLTEVTQCVYQANHGGEGWLTFVDSLFISAPEALHDETYAYELVAAAGYDPEQIRSCASSEEMQTLTMRLHQEMTYTGIYGTPLTFINDTPIVGPKPYRVYRFMLE